MTRAIAMCALLGALLLSVPAYAADWTEPDVTSLRGSLTPGKGPWLELPWTIVWQFSEMLGEAALDPRALERLANGDTLITSRDGLGVYQIAPDGSVVWSFTAADYPDLVPFHATRLASGNTLIVNRMQDTVIEVTPEKTIAWSYGRPEDDTQLIDPFTAFRLSDGNTLISDNQACRVLEVSPSGEIVWQYGHTGERAADNGYQSGYLDWPKWAMRLPNGNTLIADDEGHRVVEVTRDGTLVWSYGEAGVAGSEPGHLSHPVCAERLADGSTLITDSGNNRALTVAPDGTIVSEIGTPEEGGLDELGLNDLRRALITPTGTLLIADTRNSRVLELGHAPSGLVTSAQIDCGLPGARKRFTGITVAAEVPEDTIVGVQYSIDGNAWTAADGPVLPQETFGTFIQYRITLTTADPASTPRVFGVTIGYEPAPEQPSDDPGDGSGSPEQASDDPGDGSGSPASGTGDTGTTAAPQTKQMPGRTGSRSGASGQVPSTGGTMSSSGGYTSGGVEAGATTIAGPVTAQRGWALARVGTAVDARSPLSGTPAPLPSTEGLILLGTLYAAGIASAPLGRLVRTALSAVPAD